MRPEDIHGLMNEPTCTHNRKSKSGCAKPQPGDAGRLLLRRRPQCPRPNLRRCPHRARTDRLRQLAAHRPLSLWHDDRPLGSGRHRGTRREAPVQGDPAGGRNEEASGRVRAQYVRSRASGRRHRGRRQGGDGEVRRQGRARRLRRLLRQQEPRNRIAGDAAWREIIGRREPIVEIVSQCNRTGQQRRSLSSISTSRAGAASPKRQSTRLRSVGDEPRAKDWTRRAASKPGSAGGRGSATAGAVDLDRAHDFADMSVDQSASVR